MTTLAGKTAIISGGGAGIGRATASLFAARGANVVVTDVDVANGKATTDAIIAAGGAAVFVEHDVTDEEGWQHVVATATETFGGLDILFNNAGIYIIAPLADITLETWNKLMAINVTGTFLGMKHAAPAIAVRGGGSIINASSIAGLRGTAGHTLYGASKGAVRVMSKDVAAEYAAANVRVNSIHPTYVKTAMADYGAAIAGATVDELGAKMVPLGRLAEVDDVARVVAFLASDDASFITGAEYVIDGGGTSCIML